MILQPANQSLLRLTDKLAPDINMGPYNQQGDNHKLKGEASTSQ